MARRNVWLVVGVAAVVVVCIVVASGAAYWSYANQLPSYTPPQVVLPVPNAYDDYAAAAAMCGQVALGLWAGPGNAQAYERNASLAGVRAAVARHRAALARLRQGFGKRYCSPAAPPFPQSAGFRELARALVAEGALAEREGRMRDAMHGYLDCLRLGVDVPRGGSVIHGLIGIGCQDVGLRALRGSIDRLDAPTAAATARAMLRLDRTAPTVAEALKHQKEYTTLEMLGILRRVPFALIPKRQILADCWAYMDAIIAAARKPYWVPAALPPIPSDPLLVSNLNLVRERWARRDADWRILELRLAARAYQLQHGAPPPSAEALVPAYLRAVPRDPFADAPLVYRCEGGRVIVSSRGPRARK